MLENSSRIIELFCHVQELANLAAQLVYIKEQADFEASRRMLPPLASSLAYSNYSNWQADHQGQQLPEVVPGVSVADLYKAAEREVRVCVLLFCLV